MLKNFHKLQNTCLTYNLYLPRFLCQENSKNLDIKNDSQCNASVDSNTSINPQSDSGNVFTRILKGNKTDNTNKSANEENSLALENQKLKESMQDLNDKYKRGLADMENLRQRMQNELEKARLYSIQGFCKDLIDVADILTKACQSIPPHIHENLQKLSIPHQSSDNTVPENIEELQASFSDLYQGLLMMEKELQKVFNKHGLSQINPQKNEKFDPNIHESLFQTSTDQGQNQKNISGGISKVTKVGYKLKDRTIRPALVGVFQ
ncbi:unnamed protein product [Gordionus sp. m RMFG-2023]|uniref:grpE protein homolog 1, mitochondrial-like n=1 Tax=Gordionus sp. m RMFG-2023 TaxID=3053472 RepID=UPI0030DE7808